MSSEHDCPCGCGLTYKEAVESIMHSLYLNRDQAEDYLNKQEPDDG